ncbi:hypothetical protein OC25_26570 [Pedobacter kyungheensis]|uniref:Uncharacterized protein n=1 Tax=Pedobacter kyungheensis TaxID=1069985 RepID=A0A0C1F424_9SPHI|nr:hypothetical protein OC25_26570 [Pedobacter kyungheensis]
MLDKLVETLLATAARNEEKSFLPLFWFCGVLWAVHKFQQLLLPSSPMPEGRVHKTLRVMLNTCQGRWRGVVQHLFKARVGCGETLKQIR